MTPSVRIEDTGVLGDPKKEGAGSSLSLHAVMLGIGTLIAVLLTMFQGMRMIIQRKGQPLLQVLQGLLINIMVNAVGVAVIDSLLVASDKLTQTIMNIGFADHDAPERMVAMLLPAAANPGAVMLMALVVFLVGGAQVVLLFLRQAAIPFQALLLPIAGSGQIGGDNTRQWLPRLITTILTIICYAHGGGDHLRRIHRVPTRQRHHRLVARLRDPDALRVRPQGPALPVRAAGHGGWRRRWRRRRPRRWPDGHDQLGGRR
ncbi:hypothetical protein [Streptomyces noursei]|uniref:hypothetical protein n=1 Tax=Streptomyces noursei TaxID=1971 RepID=UPI0021A61CB4